MKPHVTIYTDGAAKGNPGPGGYGAELLFESPSGKVISKQLAGAYRLTTNNRMEMLAVIRALQALKEPAIVTLYSDSQYVIQAHEDHWIEGWIKKSWKNSKKKPVKNKDLWLQLLDLEKIHDVSYIWVKGHDGNPHNELVDTLASDAARCAEEERPELCPQNEIMQDCIFEKLYQTQGTLFEI